MLGWLGSQDGDYNRGLMQVDLLELNNSDMNKDSQILSHLLGTLGWIFQEQQALNHSRLKVCIWGSETLYFVI